MKKNSQFKTSWFWRLLPASMRRRWWLFRLFDLIARNWPVISPPSGLLIVRMDGIGDMVLFRQALEEYSTLLKIGKSDIIILGCKSWGSIASEIFEGYRMLVIDEHAFARQPLYRFKIGLMVRQLNVETTICDAYFRRAMMADSLVWLSKAKKTIVSLPFINEPTRQEFTYYLSQVSQIIDTGPYPTHETIRHYNFLSKLADKKIKPKTTLVKWSTNPKIAPTAPYVVINPGSNEYGRRWPFESYLNVAEKLCSKDFKIVIIGQLSEQAGDHRKRFGDDDRILNLAGKTPLPELMGVLKNASCTISNDTGPAHLSIALGTPTVVIVGGGHFGSFVPYPESTRPSHARFVFEEMSCYHCFWRCHKRSNKYEVFPCVSAVKEASVLKNALELIQ